MAWLDRAARRLLDRLSLRIRPRATAHRQGGHRSPTKAHGIEFADHRQYVAGDDFRRIDWKAFARHGQLTIRQFEEERDARIYVMLDVSGSMARGKPSKMDIARTIAAGFAYVGMRQFDRAIVVPFTSDLDDAQMPVYTPANLPNLDRFLDESQAAGPTALPDAVSALAKRYRQKGLVVVITDLMHPEGWEDGFRRIGALGNDLRVIRVGCKEDSFPVFKGELELYDAESEDKVRLRVGKDLLDAYAQVIKEHVQTCELACRRTGGTFIDVDVKDPLDKILKAAFADARTGRTAA